MDEPRQGRTICQQLAKEYLALLSFPGLLPNFVLQVKASAVKGPFFSRQVCSCALVAFRSELFDATAIGRLVQTGFPVGAADWTLHRERCDDENVCEFLGTPKKTCVCVCFLIRDTYLCKAELEESLGDSWSGAQLTFKALVSTVWSSVDLQLSGFSSVSLKPRSVSKVIHNHSAFKERTHTSRKKGKPEKM